jgi:predicted O-methyltransferase YrrM
MPSTFTFHDMFHSRTTIPAWEKHVVPRLSQTPNARWLEIGSCEGQSALWTLNHVLQKPDSTITCVDTWSDGKGWLIQEDTPASAFETNFDANTKSYTSRVIKLKGRSRNILPTLQKKTFHGAYIDGSHLEQDVLLDANMVWPLLLPNAVLIFDDYGSNRWSGVRRAVDIFLKQPEIRHEILHRRWQMIVIKLP